MTTDDQSVTGESADARLLVLHLLRIRGSLPGDRLAGLTGMDRARVEGLLEQAREADEVAERSGQLPGWALTATGRAAHADLLAAELRARDAQLDVERADAAFLELNAPFKELCTRWQLLADGRPNDHSDHGHDRAVIDDLEPLHARIVVVTGELAVRVPRFARYPTAFSSARDRLLRGDVKALASPLTDSYHDVWMELHQDLMSTLGRERSSADGY